MAIKRLRGGTRVEINGTPVLLKSPAICTPGHIRNEPIVGEDLKVHGAAATLQVPMIELEVTLNPENGITADFLTNLPANSVISCTMPDGVSQFELTSATLQSGNEISSDGISSSYTFFGEQGRLI